MYLYIYIYILYIFSKLPNLRSCSQNKVIIYYQSLLQYIGLQITLKIQ